MPSVDSGTACVIMSNVLDANLDDERRARQTQYTRQVAVEPVRYRHLATLINDKLTM
jgi:hypothetical protein